MAPIELQELEPTYFMQQYVFNVLPYFDKWQSKAFPLSKGLWKFVIVPHETTLGIYLECVPYDDDMNKWSCTLNGILRLKNHFPSLMQTYKQPTFFTFNYSSDDNTKKIGYNKFIELQQLYDPNNGWLNNGNITLEVSLIADGNKYEKLRDAGYVGLKNQGSTCYMNTVLQILFFTNILRRAVYQIPTETDEDRMIYCLQRIFYQLQFKTETVDIKDFTQLCSGISPFTQEDATETLRNLLNKLEAILINHNNNEMISELFEGRSVTYIFCPDINRASFRNLPFHDLQLNINGLKNIDEAFVSYIACELLDGENRYYAGDEHGLQPAIKGTIFCKYPTILHLHLMRFYYDPFTYRALKYNGRFEFPATINLDKFLLRPDIHECGDYVLHAVLVHSGELNSGHYVVFINPKADGHWMRFDDDFVRECTEDEAIEQNFGGYTNSAGYISNSSAYMLVYIRKSELDRILVDIPENNIPLNLSTRIKLEQGFDKLKVWLEQSKDTQKPLQINANSPFAKEWNDDKKIVSEISKNTVATESDMKLAKTMSILSKLFDKKLNFNDGDVDALSDAYKFNIFWISNDLKEEKDIHVLMGPNDSVRVLLKMANSFIEITTNMKAEMRLVKIENHQIIEVCKEDTLIKSLIEPEQSLTTNTIDTKVSFPTYRIEEVPVEHQHLTLAFELLLSVFHFKETITDTFGVPFLIKIKSNDLYYHVKKRIQKRLNMTDEEWKKIYLHKVFKDKCVQVREKSRVPYSIFKKAMAGKTLPRLGLEHSF